MEIGTISDYFTTNINIVHTSGITRLKYGKMIERNVKTITNRIKFRT